ncbi:MAG: hypothetical protein ACQEQM_06860 [Thermoplasmatota archaeon]
MEFIKFHESMETFKLSSRYHGLSTAYAADKFDVTQRRIQQLVKEYKDTRKTPTLKKRGRKSYREYSDEIVDLIKRSWKKYRMGAVAIAERLREEHEVKIDNNFVHMIMLENNMARENDNKKVRKKPWIRLLGTRSENRRNFKTKFL